MALQLRIYDIREGEMDTWLEVFREKVVPLHEKFDMPVRGAWVVPDRSQFVWFREFLGTGSPDEQDQRYRESEERLAAMGDDTERAKRCIESFEAKIVERVFDADQ